VSWRLASVALALAACAHLNPTFASPPEEEPVVTTLLPEPETDEAVLHRGNGSAVCALPCTAPIPRASGYYVEVTKDDTNRRVDMPRELGPPGSRLTAIVHRKRGHPGAAVALGITGAGMLLVAAVATAACARSPQPNEYPLGRAVVCTVAVVGGVSGLGMLTTGIVLCATSRRPGLEVLSRSE
jgi:hypothetical protein